MLAVAAVIADYGVYQSVHKLPPPPDLKLADVERLASGEDGWDDGGDGNFTPREGKPKNVRCVKRFSIGFTGFSFDVGHRDKCKRGAGVCIPTTCQ